MKTEYDANLHSQKHHMEVIKNNEKLVVALKAIGNSGQKRLLPQLMKIITTWDNHNAIMIAAMEAARRMVLDDAEQRKVWTLSNVKTYSTIELSMFEDRKFFGEFPILTILDGIYGAIKLSTFLDRCKML